MEKGQAATPGLKLWLHPDVRAMPNLPRGPFAWLEGGKLAALEGNRLAVSTDQGATWKPHGQPIAPEHAFTVRPERAMMRTRDGGLIVAFTNDRERSNRETGGPGPLCPRLERPRGGGLGGT